MKKPGRNLVQNKVMSRNLNRNHRLSNRDSHNSRNCSQLTKHSSRLRRLLAVICPLLLGSRLYHSNHFQLRHLPQLHLSINFLSNPIPPMPVSLTTCFRTNQFFPISLVTTPTISTSTHSLSSPMTPIHRTTVGML